MPSGPTASESEAAARPGIVPPAPASIHYEVPARPAWPCSLISLIEHRRRFYEAWEPANE